MAAKLTDIARSLRGVRLQGRAQGAGEVDRVRCVVRRERKYLLVQHTAKRPKNRGKWSLPGGRLKVREKPKVGLRRELEEELRLRALGLLKLGDWRDRSRRHRIFGCEVRRPLEWFERREIVALGWFSLSEVIELANAARLRRGFELAAIVEFETRLPAR